MNIIRNTGNVYLWSVFHLIYLKVRKGLHIHLRVNVGVNKFTKFLIQNLSVISVRIIWKLLYVIYSSFLLEEKKAVNFRFRKTCRKKV